MQKKEGLGPCYEHVHLKRYLFSILNQFSTEDGFVLSVSLTEPFWNQRLILQLAFRVFSLRKLSMEIPFYELLLKPQVRI